MTHDAIDFVLNYDSLLDKIHEIIDPEMRLMVSRFRCIDPHELISPDMTFESYNFMMNYLIMIILVEYTDYGHSLYN